MRKKLLKKTPKSNLKKGNTVFVYFSRPSKKKTAKISQILFVLDIQALDIISSLGLSSRKLRRRFFLLLVWIKLDI